MNRFIDTGLLKYLAIFYTVFYGIFFIQCAYFDLFNVGRFNSYSELFFYSYFLDWFFVLAFMMLISLMTKRMFRTGFSWKSVVIVHLFLAATIGYFVNFFSGLVMYLFGGFSWYDSLGFKLRLGHYIDLLDLNFLIYFSMAGIINVYYYIQEVKNIELQKFQLKDQLANTRLKILKSQLQPHFIFNTLNSVSSLMEIDTGKSQTLLSNFSDLLRDVLDLKDENLITLGNELNLLNKYTDIIHTRFADHLLIEKNIEPHLDLALVPNMILQPLFENSIKYGYSYHHTKLKITIEVFERDKRLHIILENDGKLLDSSFDILLKKGIGLSNINDRLITLYKDNYTFHVGNKEDNSGVVARLVLPLVFETREA